MLRIHRDTEDKRQFTGQERRQIVLQMAFFPGAILYGELLLRLFDSTVPFFTMALARIFCFSIAAGLLLYVLLDLIPWPKLSRTLAGVLLLLGTVYICTEYCCKAFFGLYFSVGYMAQMAGSVAGDFAGNAIQVVIDAVPFILLALVPLAVFLAVRIRFFRRQTGMTPVRVTALVILAVLQLAGSLLSATGAKRNLYTYDFQTNTSIGEFGALTTLRLEMQYGIFGKPEEPLIQIQIPTESTQDTTETTVDTTEDTVDTTETTGGEETTETMLPPPVYDFNTLDIDFAALENAASNDTVRAMHKYFGSLTPSQQNEYTGYFAGKNLILITAEAFCPYAISEELTPTLYKLANESFVFTNYYQPDWHQSTAGGEFAVLTGLIPTWQGDTVALRASADVAMPFTLGWGFEKLGYSSLAYHNNSYRYYDRHLSHPNFGYEWTAIGNGLELASSNWPNSDLEMMEATVDGYIQAYLETGKNFHTYYMTVSGHANYNWPGNNMASKNKQTAQAAYPNNSEAVQAYIACNLELEYAMEHLVKKLEAAGIADETVIVLTSDHYPYGMVDNSKDYYVELSGVQDTVSDTSRYKNSLIMWCGAMEETVVVDTPCSAIDIVPTLCNLFGLEYDSRLYSGRDVFATNYQPDKASTCMPLVVMPIGSSYSWITAAGTYEAATGVFTPNPGVQVDAEYVDLVKQLVNAKFSYARQVLQRDYYGIIQDALEK